MRPIGILGAIAIAAAGFAPASADEPASLQEAMARLIHAAMAPSDHGDWVYTWDGLSTRVSSLMHWHLAGRDDPDEPTITRRGWISTAGKQAGVTAYGEDDTVSSLSFEAEAWYSFNPGPTSLLPALAAQDITVVEMERRKATEFSNTDEPVIVYALSAPDRDTLRLTHSIQCTSPRSAAAQRCESHYTLALGR
jgi:hypothetical protein